MDNITLALKPVDKPYKEIGSIEGTACRVEVDDHDRSLLYVCHRLTGNIIKCILIGEALAIVKRQHIDAIYSAKRVFVRGVIHYRSLRDITHVEENDIRFARPENELPTIDDILDETFTGGLTAEEYFERLRDGGLS